MTRPPRLSLGLLILCACGPSEPAPSPPAAQSPASPQAPATRAAAGGDLDLQAALESAATVTAVGDGLVHELAEPELAETNERYWREESVANELAAVQLRALARALRGDVERRAVLDVFTGDARVAGPEPAGEGTAEPVTDGLVRRRWPAGADELVAPAEWLAAVERYAERFQRVRWTKLKPAEVRLTDYGAEALLKYSLAAELPSGGLWKDSGVWRAELVPGGETWRIRRLEPHGERVRLESAAPHFVDATLEALRDTGLDPRLPQTSAVAAFRGLALEDLDGDGDLDIVVTVPNRVLMNLGDGTFQEIGEDVGVLPEPGFYAVLAADFDRDGGVDLLFAGHLRHSVLYLRRGLRFERKELAVTHADNLAASLAAHDVDGDGWLDVFLSGYGPFTLGPDDPTNATNGRPNQMLRGGPGGEFEDVTAAWGLDAEHTRWTFVGAFGDADGDGDSDLYAANDFGPNVLYRRADGGDVRFEAELEDPEAVDSGFSMSATWADVDGDLDLDLYVSNMSSTAAKRVAAMPGDERELGSIDGLRARMSKGNTLLLAENGRLVEGGEERGAKDASWAWGAALFDYDADGDLDIHCVNGYFSIGRDDGRDL